MKLSRSVGLRFANDEKHLEFFLYFLTVRLDFVPQVLELSVELGNHLGGPQLEEKDALISIQSKVIGLLDDADQTLQKSIEEKLLDR